MTGDVEQTRPALPVARLLTPVIWRTAALVALAVVICVTGVLVSESALRRLSEEVEPAVAAHARFEASVADLDSATSAWALTGEPSARVAYRAAHDELDTATAELRRQASGTDVHALVNREIAQVDRWIDDYTDPVVAGGAGPLEPEQYAAGQRAYSGYRQARAATVEALATELDQVESSAAVRLRLTLMAAVILLGAAVILVSRARKRLLTEVAEPLMALEEVALGTLRHDPPSRAAVHDGPREVRSIARALNDFADAGSRAEAVEGRIQDELHVLDSAKDDFVSNVSHELRTPLTTISGYLEIIADEFEGKLAPRHDRMLEATRRNVIRLRALIDDLLALSKAENRPSELEPVDVTDLVIDAVTDVRMAAARRGITIDVAASNIPMPVLCDRALLYRAFLNVLGNAVKFSHDDGSVEVSVRRVLSRVEIVVRDHGIGIPSAEIDRLGTRFFRASNAMDNEIAGTGLGLRIVQTIIDRHAGDVVIESIEGEGTTVFVRLQLHGDRYTRLTAVASPAADGIPAGSRDR